MTRFEKLTNLARSKGLDILRIEIVGLNNHAKIIYHSIKRAGLPPVLEHCRDRIDYAILRDQWLKQGEEHSQIYASFDDLVTGELLRLKTYGK